MEQEGLNYLAQRTDKPLEELEEMWDKSKALAKHEYEISHNDSEFNPIAAGILKRQLKIKQVEINEGVMHDFLIILEGGVVVEEDQTTKKPMLIENSPKAKGSTQLLHVQYVKKDDKGTFKEYRETFNYHEDGDPIFPVKNEMYQNLIGRNVGQHWSKYVNEPIHSYVKNEKKNRFWVKCEETGNMYKYVVPKRQIGEIN
jgi:hypothetical protein